MATFVQSSASKKAPTTTGTSITSAILNASAKAVVPAPTVPHPIGTGSVTPNGSVKKPIVNVGTHSHERSGTGSTVTHHHHESTADLSVKIKSTAYDSHTEHGHEKAKLTGYDFHEKKLTVRDSDVYEKYKSLNSCETRQVAHICITEEEKHILHKGTRSLGDVIGQVPWMKFRIIAEPNMDCFASDERLRTFIRQTTELTVSIVTKQCADEIAVLTSILTASLSASIHARTKLIEETIVEQIASLCLEDSMTACLNLDRIKEKVCFPQHHDHSKYGTHHDSDKHHPHGLPHANKNHAHNSDDSHNHTHNGCEC